jgi:hypothetical protein
MNGRKILGFIVGCVGCAALITWMFSGTHSRPVGAGWLVLTVLSGSLTAHLFSRSQDVKASATAKWFSASSHTRLMILLSTVWVIVAYFAQDDYDREEKWIILPVLTIWAFGLGYRYLVAPENKPQGK